MDDQWKAEALAVLTEWREVYELLGRPGPLGGSIPANCLAAVEKLIKENSRLRDEVKHLMVAMSFDEADLRMLTDWMDRKTEQCGNPSESHHRTSRES